MAYIERVIMDDERVLHRAHISWFSQLPLLILGLPLLLVSGLGLLLWLVAVIRYYSTELAITNKRIIAKFGFIGRTTIEINLPRVESIQVRQGLFGRLFNYGTLIVSGAGNPQAPIPGIADPLGFRRAFAISQEHTARREAVAAA